jgi:hypothetical protein
MRSLLLAAALVLSSAQAQPPDTEVFLADLKLVDGRISVSAPRNISSSPGYDNQPSFTPDGTGVLLTSARAGTPPGATAAQMDIYRYDIATQKLSQVTSTPESEYSATVTPDGKHISVIRVEADKAQRLWKFPLAGGAPSLVFTDIKPVGYHAWLDADTVAMFVLGEPATLQVGDVRTGKAEVIASDIGRSLQPVPGGGVSFIQRAGQGAQRTMTVALLTAGRTTKMLTPLVPGATEEFVAWMPDGTLLMAASGQLHAWKQGEKEWRAIADLSALGLRNVSRLAVSPKGDRLALVAAR